MIELEDFVPEGQIDPVFFEKTYYVGCRDDAEAYRVLMAALERTGRVGIGRFTFHNREYLVAARSTACWAAHDALPRRGRRGRRPRGGQAGQAQQARGRDGRQARGVAHRKFDPADYEDSYREAVLDLIKRKAKGEDTTPEEPEPEEEPADLTAALQASLGS